MNDACAELVGLTREQIIGRSSTELGIWADPTHADRLHAAMSGSGSTRHFKTLLRRTSGELRDIELSTELIEIGSEPCVLGVVLDVTERTRAREAEEALRRTEHQLHQIQKIEAIGSLASGIAHDFNNIISIVLSYSDLILETLPPADPVCEDIREIRHAGERATDLTRQLLAFSRKQRLDTQLVDVNALVRGLAPIFRRILPERLEVSFVFDANVGSVFVDRGQLEQLLLNLILNARDAMPDTGRIAIETTESDIDEPPVSQRTRSAPGPYVVLTVSDTGIGMDAATQERMFEPFFTTKPRGTATGLGLVTVSGIVQQSRGHIRVESELGKGTTVRVLLPRDERRIDTPKPPPIPDTLRGTESILLVEDDEVLRRIVRDTLRRHGYDIIETANAGEALLEFEHRGGAIDMLLTDVVLPRFSGPALAERLALVRPGFRVLYMSGYPDDSTLAEVSRQGAALLPKPVTPAAVLSKVREVLDSPSPSTR